MRVDRNVTGRPHQVFTRAKVDVFLRLFVQIAAGDTKVNHVNSPRLVIHAHHDIVGLDVPVNETSAVHVLEPLYDLREHNDVGLQRELTPAVIEQIFQRRSQQLSYHIDVVLLHDDSLMFEFGKPMAFEES